MQKERIIGIALMILGIIGIVVLSLMPPSTTINPAHHQLTVQNLAIDEISWKRNTSQYECDMTIPQIQNINTPDVAGLNADILAHAEKFLSYIPTDMAEKDGESAPYSYDISYKINKGTDNILDIIISSYTYTGGAHGMAYDTIYHLDILNGKELSFDDIFKSGTKEYFEKKILAQMAQEPDNYFEDAKPNINEANFYFDNGEVVIVFGLYAIAPYVSGMPEFRFKKDDIKQWLKKL